MNKESSKKKKTIILLSLIVILLILVFAHPWTQLFADQRMGENFPGLHAVLTDWQPFGNSFDIRFYSPEMGWLTFGHGFVDTIGRVKFYDFNDGLVEG